MNQLRVQGWSGVNREDILQKKQIMIDLIRMDCEEYYVLTSQDIGRMVETLQRGEEERTRAIRNLELKREERQR
jgi:hypothetical protein